MDNIALLKSLIEKDPENHGLKTALLDSLLESERWNDIEISCYTFLSHISKEDPFYSKVEEYLQKIPAENEEKSSILNEVEEMNFEEKVSSQVNEKVGFDEIGGMEEVKKKISRMIIKPFENEDLYRAYNKKIGGGLLLYGPPGCGKTHIARAIAHEIHGNFIHVSLHQILDMWTGNSEKNLHEFFQKARRNSPCVLFFDEVDALSFQRSKIQNGTENRIINQFLNELDGVESTNDKILIIGATNLPWNIDPAFRRPGRFDHILFAPPPDLEARKKIIEIYLSDKPHQDNINTSSLAKITKGFSGADINHLVNEAGMECFEKAMEEDSVVKISEKLLQSIIKKMKPSTSEWFTTATRYLEYSNEDGKYDEIDEYLKKQN